MSLREGESMRSLTISFALALFAASGSLSLAQSSQPDDKAAATDSTVVSKEEVNQLRNELAAQRQTIEELKALVEKLAEAKNTTNEIGAVQVRPVVAAPSRMNASAESPLRLRNAVLLEAEVMPMV